MSEQILKNIWNNLTQAGLTTNDFETWNTNFQSNEGVQSNIHEYLVNQDLTTSDFSTWSNNLGLKKKDESDFISEEEVTESSTQEDRIAAGQSASSVLPTPEVEQITALNVTENIVPLSDDEASKGVLSNQSSNQTNPLYQQGYYTLNDNQKNSFATAVLNGSINPLNDMTDPQFQGLDVSNLAVGKTAVELIEENFTEDGVTLNGVFHAPGTKTYQLAESLIEDKDISRGKQIDINSATLNYVTSPNLDASEESINELITQYGADIDDNTLRSMGVDKKEYIDFVRKNYRAEDKLYKFVRGGDNFGLGRFFGEENQIKANEVQRKAKREEEQYQRAMMFKKNKLESLLKDKSYLEAQLKRTEDPAEYKTLQAEIDKYDSIINTNLGQMMNLDEYFPNYKEHLSAGGTAQILKKKRVYDAARGNAVDVIGAQTSETLKEGIYGLGNLGNGIINYIPELADEFFSVLGGDNKGIWAGLSKNIRDNMEDYKMGEEGQVERKLVLQGKPVEYKGELYRVDDKSNVYDEKTGVEMTGIITPTDLDNIRKNAANIPDSDSGTVWVGNSAIPKIAGTVAYMYGLIRSGRGFSNKLQGLGMKGKKAGYVGMGLSSYTASMTNNVQSIKDDLMKKGFTEEDALERAMVFGHTISTFDGLFAGLAGSNQKLLTGLGGVRKQLYNLVIKDPKKFNSAELKRKANDLLKENLKEVFIEEIPVYLSEKGVNYLMNEYVGSEVRDAKVRQGEIEEVMLLTVGATSSLGGKQLFSSKDRAQTIDYISQNFTQEDIKKRLESLRKEGLLEEGQAENVFNEVYNMNAANNQTQGTVQMAENKEPMADLLNRRRKLMDKRKGLEGPLKEDIDKEINAVDNQIRLLANKDKEEVEQEYKNQEDASTKPSAVAQTSPDQSTTTEEVVEGVSSEVQQPTGESETEADSDLDTTTQEEVRTDFRINDVAGRPTSISYNQGGKVVNEEVADKKAARKRINQLKFEDQGFTGVLQSSNPNVELELVEGEVIATNKKTGNKKTATPKFFNEYMDAMQFTGVDSNVETMVNEGEIEGDQAVDFIIENSQNPVEIANQLQQTDKTIKGDTELEAPWEADFRLRKIRESDFDKLGDPNFTNTVMKRRWFVPKKQLEEMSVQERLGLGLDVIAEELSSDYNQEITVDMLIEYIKSNPSRKAPARTRTQTNEQRVSLEQKFQELTGLKPTARNIRGVAGKEMITQPKSETERQAREIEQMEASERGEVQAEQQLEEDLETEPQSDSESSMAPDSKQTATNYSNNKSQALLNLFDKIKVAKDKLLTMFYDKYRPVRNLQKAIEKKLGRKMSVDKNFDIAEDLVYGKIRNKIDNFNTEMFNFFDKLSKKNIDRETLDEYLYAKHAVERNSHIREATDGENDAGSGMTDTEAQQILDKFESDGLTQDLEQAADFIYTKTRETLDILKNEDLLSQTEYDNLLNNEYQNYVPLTGFDQLDVDRSKQTNMGEGGKTLPIRGKEIKTATGRKTKAASPLANIMKARERAIMRGGKNNVLVNLLDMLIESPDNDLYMIYSEDKPSTYKSINKDGKVIDRAQSLNDMKNNTQLIRVVKGGKDYFIKFENDALQQSINNGMINSVKQTNDFIKGALLVNRAVTNVMRKVYTTLSPAFIAVNYMRDFQTGLLNAMSELDAPLFSKDMGRAVGKIAKVSLLMPKTIYAYNQGKMTDGKGNLLSDQELKDKGYNPEYAKYYREFLDNGGQTGYGYSKSIDQLKADIDAVSKPTTFKRFSRGLSSIINAANIAAENSTRMAAFIEARQRGMSSAEAAQLAKNLTVNFNKSGSAETFRSLYLFFNASVGGTVRFAQAVTKLTKTQPGKGSKVLEWAGQKDRDFNPAQKLAFILTNFSMMVAMLNGYNDEEDEDGVSYYEKIPDYVKTRNMVIMLPNQKGKYVKIPLPYGYNVFHNIGTAVGDGVTGKRTVGEGVGNVGVGMLEAFSPLSFNNSKDLRSFGINFVPSSIRPLAEVQVNENYFGSQIYKEAYPGQQISDAYLGKYKPGVANQISTFLAQAANEATGGSKRRSGKIDINPDAVDYLMKQYLGVIYDMSTSTLDSGAEAYETFIEKKPKKEFDWKDIPIAGQLGKRFVGENSRYADISTYYERKEYLKSLNEEFKDILKGEGEFHFPKTVYGKAAALLNLSKDLDKELVKFRELKKIVKEKIDKEGGTQTDFDRIKTIEKAEDKIVDKFNEAFLKLFKRYSTKNKPVEVSESNE